MLTEEHLEALGVICERLKRVAVDWAVTGSTALAAQEVPLQPHDIDLQADADGAYALAGALAEYMVRPVAFSSTDRIRSHFGAAVISGIEVEIMGAVEVRRPDGSWRPAPDMRAREWVKVEELRIPVLPLQHEYAAYVLLGRPDRAEMVRKHMVGAVDPVSDEDVHRP